MAINPSAILDYLPSSSGGAFTGGPSKGVAHKTQGATYAGAKAAYIKRSLGPHFTIGEESKGAILFQHLDTNVASSAVANDSGGVQTNRDGAIQVEIVGFSGQTMGSKQTQRFKELQLWLRDTLGIPISWPMGRPPKDSATGYGENNGHRDAAVWDSTSGWYAHSQVPENEHWDPAWTDEEWEAINGTTTGDDNMTFTQTELDQMAVVVRTQVLDIVRKDGISGAADAGASNVDNAVLDQVIPRLQKIEDQLSTGGTPGSISDADIKRIVDAVISEIAS